MINALKIDPADNVIVAIVNISKDTTISWDKGMEITAQDDIPVYHKAACQMLPEGSKVVKYGECIGIATQDINPGAHVHVHNIKSATHGKEG